MTLQAQTSAGDTMQMPSGTGPGSKAAVRFHVSNQIGPYVLKERLGKGGFGEVYKAEQLRPVKREVALKLILPGMGSPEIVARFEAERQALAMMDHPNIATVHDAGTTQDGRPYFVMELVQGSPLSVFCDEEKLPLRERLSLFIAVCHGVHHAHQKGIIHRDLKPSNILVCKVDGVPLVKVIDFGIAKAMAGEAEEMGMKTAEGQLIGTPQYMSPEQASGIISGMDTRSDIYSLGIILYELLVGEPPISASKLSEAGFLEVVRMICEDEIRRPSTKVSTARTARTSGEAAPGVTTLMRIQRDLDWIVMKALEKQPARRYDSASALAEDLRRYLANEPVSAAPPSVSYRMGKFARRHRAAFAGGLAVAASLLLGLGASLWQAVRATRAEQTARIQEQAASARNAISDNPREALRMALEAAERDRGMRGHLSSPVLSSLLHTLDHAREWGKAEMPEDVKAWAWTDDAKTLCLTAKDGLWLFDRTTGAKRKMGGFPGGTKVTAMGFMDRTLVAGDAGGGIFAMDLSGGSLPWPEAAHQGTVVLCAWLPQLAQILTVGTDRKVRFLDKDGKPAGPGMDLAAQMPSLSVAAMNASRTRVILGSDPLDPQAEVRLLHLEPGSTRVIKAENPGHSGIGGLAFDHLGQSFFGITSEGQLIQWNADGRVLSSIALGRSHRPTALAHHPEEPLIFVGTEGGGIEVLTHQGAQGMPTLAGHQGLVTQLGFLNDGCSLVSCANDGSMRFWDLLGSQSMRPLPLGMKSDSVLFSEDGRRLAVGSVTGEVRGVDLLEGASLFSCQLFKAPCSLVRAIPGRSLLVCAAPSAGEAAFLDWEGREVMPRLKVEGSLDALSVSPDGRSLAVIFGRQSAPRLQVWMLADRECRPAGDHALPDRMRYDKHAALVHSPDGRHLAARVDQYLQVFDALPPFGRASKAARLENIRPHAHVLAVTPGEGLLISTAPSAGARTARLGWFELPGLRQVAVFDAAWPSIHRLLAHPRREWTAVFSQGNACRIHDRGGVMAGPELAVNWTSAMTRGAAWSESSSSMAVAALEDQVRFFGMGEDWWMALARWRLQGRQEELLAHRQRQWKLTHWKDDAREILAAQQKADKSRLVLANGISARLPEGWEAMDAAAAALLPKMASLVLGSDASRLDVLGAARGPSRQGAALLEQNLLVALVAEEMSQDAHFIRNAMRARQLLKGRIEGMARRLPNVRKVEENQVFWDDATGMVRGKVTLVLGTGEIRAEIYLMPLRTGMLGFFAMGDPEFHAEVEEVLGSLETPLVLAVGDSFKQHAPRLLEEALAEEDAKKTRDNLISASAAYSRERSLAEAARKRRDFEAAAAHYTQALEVARDQQAESNAADWVANEIDTLVKLSSVHREARVLDKSASCLEEALAGLERARSLQAKLETQVKLAEAESEARHAQALLTRAQGRHAEALSFYDQAVAATRRIADPSSRIALENKAVTLLRDKAGCLRDLGRHEESLACARESLAILDAMPANLRDSRWGVRCLDARLAILLTARSSKDRQLELATGREAVKLGRDLYPPGQPKNLREGCFKFIECLTRLVESLEADASYDRPEVIRLRAEIVDAYGQLEKQGPLSTVDLGRFQGWSRGLGDRESQYGEELSKARHADAADWLNQAEARLAEVLKKWPAPENRTPLATALRRRVEHRLRHSEPAAALADSMREVALRKEFLAGKPGPDARRELAQALVRLGSCLGGAKRAEESVAALREAADLLQAVLKEQPGRQDVRQQLSGYLYRMMQSMPQDSGQRPGTAQERAALWTALPPSHWSGTVSPDRRKEAFWALTNLAWMLDQPESPPSAQVRELLKAALSILDPAPDIAKSDGNLAKEAARARQRIGGLEREP